MRIAMAALQAAAYPATICRTSHATVWAASAIRCYSPASGPLPVEPQGVIGYCLAKAPRGAADCVRGPEVR